MSDALQQRNALKRKKPHFRRQDSHKLNKLDTRWRRPKGIHSKMRLRKKGYARHVECGWGSPASVRGLSREGLQPILVHTVQEVMKLNPKTQGAIIGASVGARKKTDVFKAAQEKKVKVLNVKDLSKQEEAFKQRQATRKEWEKKKAAKKETKKASKPKEDKMTKEEEKKELDKVLTQTQ